MKNTTKSVICFFVCLLLTVSFVLPVEAKAASNDVVSGSDPVVVGLTGDLAFTTTVIDQANIPGSVLQDQEYLPVGYSGAMQFNGKGVEVKGVTNGTEKACFNFDLHNYGWTGNVYQWNGAKWVKLNTTITNHDEGNTVACAVIHGNGVYALLDALTTPQTSSFAVASGETSDYGTCPDTVSASLSLDSYTSGKAKYTLTFTWTSTSYSFLDVDEYILHLSSGSTGTLADTSGYGFSTTYYTSPHAVNGGYTINGASILDGTTTDIIITLEAPDYTYTKCKLAGIEVPSTDK